jgi:hypothetical protein
MAIVLCLSLFSCYSGGDPEIMTGELTGNKETDNKDGENSEKKIDTEEVKASRPPEAVPVKEESTGLMIHQAASGKYFKRIKDGVYFGSKIALASTDSISNYTEVDIPSFSPIPMNADNMPYTISEGGIKLGLNPFVRCIPNSGMTIETYFDYFVLQSDGPRGEFPIGKWLSVSEPLSNEELIITGLTLFRYTDYNFLHLIEYPYKIENGRMYIGNYWVVSR